jgi:glycine/D-amino acid oxidase-like deaminating enzyme
MSGHFDLVVIGAGVHGSTVALFAARGGMKVAVIERDQVCRGASGVNAGTLTMQMTRVALIPMRCAPVRVGRCARRKGMMSAS